MEMDERNLSRSARRKMAQRARKTAKKRAIRRKARAKRMKTRGQLSSAAEKVAKNILVKKMTGGKKYGQLSIGQKEMVDKKIAKKPGLVKKIARKVLPKIKAKEKDRIKKARSAENVAEAKHGVFTLNKGAGEVKVSARYIKGELAPYTFTNKTQAKKHSDKVGGKVFKTPNGRVFYVEFTKLDGPVNEYVGPKYKTANEIKKQWKKEYPNDKFTFKKVRAKGSEWLLVISPKGVELERYQYVPKTGWIEMNENKDNEEDLKSMLDIAQLLSAQSPYFKGRGSKKEYIKMLKSKLNKLGIIAAQVAGDHRLTEASDNEEDLKSLKSMLDIAQLLSAQSPYFKARGSKKEYIKMLLHKIKKLSESHEHFLEIIKVPISIGDTVLGGKFKNKKIVVKKIGKNEKGDFTINGKPLMKVRLVKQKGQMFKEGSKKKKTKPTTRMDAYKQVRKSTMPKSRPMKNKKAYDRKDYKRGKYD